MGGYANIVKKVVVSAAHLTAMLMKTGQTTSYRTGDDGDIEAGRLAAFLILNENNLFGNTARFTDKLGGSTYGDSVAIDWSTYEQSTGNFIMWKITDNGANTSWNNCIDGALGLNFAGYTDWFLPNINHYCSIFNYELDYLMNYPPFNRTTFLGANDFLWTSTTVKRTTTNAIYIEASYTLTNYIFAGAKTLNCKYMAVRIGNISELTLP